LTFTVTNNTNGPMDFALLAANVGSGDIFDTTGGFTYYLDDGDGTGDGVYGTGGDVQVTELDEMPSDAVWTVFVVSNIPNGLVSTNDADITLLATAHDAGGAGLGALTAEDDAIADTTTGIENVFNDGDGDVDGLRDGAHSATNTYLVASASIAVTKSSAVVYDPLNGVSSTGNPDPDDDVYPKAIPGARMVYCIAVANSGGVAATDVTVSDPIPANTTYFPGSIRVVAGPVTCDVDALTAGDAQTDANTEDGDGPFEADQDSTPVGTHGDFGGTAAGAVTTVTSLPAGTTTTTIFQVTID
jgi:uncharacterized repeat protein (TIGR01451 family)